MPANRPEYVLWALPIGTDDRLHERVMTSTPHKHQVEHVKRLATISGWHSFRVQVIDGSRVDFAGALNT